MRDGQTDKWKSKALQEVLADLKMTYSEQKSPQPEDRPGCPQGSEFLIIVVARKTCDT